MTDRASASGLMRWLPASPLGYTREVPSWSLRLTCLALAFALSGSPAVLAACMALCVDSPVTTAGHVGHGALAAEVAPEAASHAHHHDHGAAAAPTTAAAALLPAVSQAFDARLMPTCTDCCLERWLLSPTGLRAERRDADVAGVASTTPMTSFDLSRVAHAAAPPSPPIPPTLPARAPLALRI